MSRWGGTLRRWGGTLRRWGGTLCQLFSFLALTALSGEQRKDFEGIPSSCYLTTSDVFNKK